MATVMSRGVFADDKCKKGMPVFRWLRFGMMSEPEDANMFNNPAYTNLYSVQILQFQGPIAVGLQPASIPENSHLFSSDP